MWLRSSDEVAAGTKVELECKSRSGAALILNYPTTRKRALSSKAMEAYLIDNCVSWLRVAKGMGLPVELHDLVFVQECTLTGDWATAVWHESSCGSNIGFNIGTGSGVGLSLSFWGHWEDRVTIPTRLGPKCTEENRRAYSMDRFDQCIFLKGIRAALREWYEKLSFSLWARAAEQDGPDSQDPARSILHSSKKSDLKIKTIGARESFSLPVSSSALL